ncbi:hypothetical protein H310_14183 [Aphanomyces invadans]|uniref:Uncharacterized protein n=1 Tax=Aphanomyces invadans TaxID=157072 RepID=A0A024TC53_9STRA|nr:hypothetical protein H310_14183 [Aphanomyces invadans]ETV91181.1 hypothetical protein H310_14183 [Aphanomyces invadans]|eukprot:XP_008880212.1 hypothetical protein H310_14183 [Aphanomyces invadans]
MDFFVDNNGGGGLGTPFADLAFDSRGSRCLVCGGRRLLGHVRSGRLDDCGLHIGRYFRRVVGCSSGVDSGVFDGLRSGLGGGGRLSIGRGPFWRRVLVVGNYDEERRDMVARRGAEDFLEASAARANQRFLGALEGRKETCARQGRQRSRRPVMEYLEVVEALLHDGRVVAIDGHRLDVVMDDAFGIDAVANNRNSVDVGWRRRVGIQRRRRGVVGFSRGHGDGSLGRNDRFRLGGRSRGRGVRAAHGGGPRR